MEEVITPFRFDTDSKRQPQVLQVAYSADRCLNQAPVASLGMAVSYFHCSAEVALLLVERIPSDFCAMINAVLKMNALPFSRNVHR